MRRAALALALLLALAGVARAEEPAAYDAASCNACHAALLAKQHVHSLFPGLGCDSCHAPADQAGKCKGPAPGSKGWKLTAAEPALCTGCHDQMKPGSSPMHSVIDSVGCTACHDPHSTDFPNQLKVQPTDALCAQCHDRKDQKKSVHTPVKKGDCLGCHDPHVGQAPDLLKAATPKLCFGCHKPETLARQTFKHAPVMEGRCDRCHDAHATDLPKQTLAAGKAACLPCHDAKKPVKGGAGPGARLDLDRKTVHAAVETGDCQDCHVAGHSSARPHLLGDVRCAGCHEGKDDQPFAHGAARLGECSGCHEPHATDTAALLRAEDAKLCFRCHDDDVTGRTSVHKPVAEGKCDGCHDPHGSASPFALKAGAGEATCRSCHPKVAASGKRHAALERHGCTACHDAHGSDHRTLLIKDVNPLCVSCHPEQSDGQHVTTMVAGGHKVDGGPDPHAPARDLSCASCHDPHAATSPKLLRYGDSSMESCDFCHGDRSGKRPDLKDIHRVKRPSKPPPEASK